MVAVEPYEKRLNADRRWALLEGSMHFEKESAVHRTMHDLASRLEELAIPYAVVGGMALFQHGFRRFTEDVDVLVTPDGLSALHQALEGLGYLPPFPGSRNLRDTRTGVRIEFLVSGAYPGDGKPKPVSFPDPRTCSQDIDGIKCLTLEKLVELKLAAGTAEWRLKDLADVQELIRLFDLPESFAKTWMRPCARHSFA